MLAVLPFATAAGPGADAQVTGAVPPAEAGAPGLPADIAGLRSGLDALGPPTDAARAVRDGRPRLAGPACAGWRSPFTGGDRVPSA